MQNAGPSRDDALEVQLRALRQGRGVVDVLQLEQGRPAFALRLDDRRREDLREVVIVVKLAEFVADLRECLEDLLRPSARMTRCRSCIHCGIDESLLLTPSGSIGECQLSATPCPLAPAGASPRCRAGASCPVRHQLADNVGRAPARQPIDLRPLAQLLPKDDAFCRLASEKTLKGETD